MLTEPVSNISKLSFKQIAHRANQIMFIASCKFDIHVVTIQELKHQAVHDIETFLN